MVALARADLEDFFATLDLSRPEVVRDALIEFVPILVREYGDLSSVVAAEWYEEVRAREVGGRYAARLGSLAADEAVIGGVRYAAGNLWTATPEQTLAVLSGAIQRHVQYGGRSAVARNVAADPKRPRFARVPSGVKTCAFCTMLASRGFVYHSESTAGEHDDWHDDCDCQVVMSWDRDEPHIEGYDPDRMYGEYMAATEEVGGAHDTAAILAAMRQMHGLT